ncbi:MAG: hypothetical protein WKF87_04085 [Chryseolinea sp.]
MTVGLQSIGFGQTFTEQVYRLAENFSDEECEAFAECDCCSSDIFFLSTNKFCFISRCISGDSYFTGTFLIQSNKLKLSFNKKYVDEITDEDYKVVKLETKTKNTDPIEFNISKCGPRVHLTHPITTEWRNGSRYEQKRESELMMALTSSKPWKQLSEYGQLLPTKAIKHMLYCKFLRCMLLNFVSNGGQSCRYLTATFYS